ncbi:MAG: YafY family protein [Anaerolineae bacterium]
MNRTDRLLAITLELHAHRYTRAEDLAAQFEVSVRTIYRDVEALCEAGVPVVATPGYGYSLAEGYFLTPVMLTADEAGMLLLGAAFVADQVDTPYRSAVETAQKKIEKILPAGTRGEVEFLRDSFRFMSGIRPRDPAIEARLTVIRRAIRDHAVLHLRYHARHGEPGERDVEPYGLVQVGGAWLLLAYCRVRQDTRGFRLDRIDSATPTGERFTRRQSYSVRQPHVMEYGDIEVRVLVPAAALRWVREGRHFTWVADEPHPDGAVMIFRPRSLRELLPWLLSWGPDVTVLSPPEMQQALRDAAAALLTRYSPANP